MHLPELLENAVLTHRENSYRENDHTTGVFTLFSAIQTEDVVQPIKLKVKEYEYRGQDLPKTIASYFNEHHTQDDFASAYDGHVLMLESIEKEGTSSSAATMPEPNSDVNHPSVPSMIKIADSLRIVNGDARK